MVQGFNERFNGSIRRGLSFEFFDFIFLRPAYKPGEEGRGHGPHNKLPRGGARMRDDVREVQLFFAGPGHETMEIPWEIRFPSTGFHSIVTNSGWGPLILKKNGFGIKPGIFNYGFIF